MDYYLKRETKKGFRDWTKEGLEFLLRRGELKEEIERGCKRALNKALNIKTL